MIPALQPKADEVAKIIDEIGDKVENERFTLADAIRLGSRVTDQKIGSWYDDDGSTACALSAAYIAARARGFIK